MDFSYEMVSQCKNKNIKLEPLVADAEYMPFETSTFDLIISSFTLHWCQQIDKIFSDIFRILKYDGNFMFTTVGPDTLKELRDAYKVIDSYEHINTFDDMHTYGDILLSSGFHDPVMDVERLIIEYKNFNEVLQSLRKTGASTVIYNESKFTTKKSLKNLENHYKKSNKNGLFPVTYEMIYGIAWKKGTQNSKNNEVVIPIKISD
jgi:malonyl-CoA O-methyltransferase